MGSKSKRQSFLEGAVILAVSTIVVKALGALFKVPLMNLLGGVHDEMHVRRVLGYALSIAGFPAAVSRLVSESVAQRRYRDARKIVRLSVWLFLAVGGVGFCLLFFGSGLLCRLVGNPDARLAVAMLAPSLLFGCVTSAVRGYYQGMRNMIPTAVSQVVEQFGYDRTLYVLANTVRHKEHDGRISRDNKTWARTIPIYEDPDAWGNDRNVEFVVDGHNPGLVDLFINAARHEYLLTQPLTKDDIRAEAARILSAFQAAREPNSPSGTHFMVQVSPDFLARANSKNQNRLVSMLPFRSLSISTLEGRKGVYALITKDEDRDQSLRLRKPSVRKKLSETKAEPGHTDKKKVREQER